LTAILLKAFLISNTELSTLRMFFCFGGQAVPKLSQVMVIIHLANIVAEEEQPGRGWS
jgi:hypothetical protein